MTRPIAFAAPVEVGTMLRAAARARRRSLCGPSCRFWSAVYAWIVVIRPRSMPKASLRTLASGARQLVVQDALLMIVCEPSYRLSLTPMTIVMSSSLAGAEMMTFFAPPASTWLRASAALVKKPVDSMTTSTPRSPQGRLAGSRSDSTFMVLPPILMPSPSAAMSSPRTPRMLSYLSRCARTSGLVRSLTATISMSWPLAAAARQKFRPMRPKPLMPTRTVTEDLHAARRGPRVRGCGLAHTKPYRSPTTPAPAARSGRTGAGAYRSVRVLLREHVVGDDGFCVGDAEVLGPLVGHGQETPYPPGHRVLGHRRVGPLTQLLQRGLPELQAQPAGHEQVLGSVVGEDLQGPLDAGAGRDGRTRRATEVRVVEVGQPVRRGPDLAAHPPLLPGEDGVVRAHAGQQRADCVAVPDDDAVESAHLARLGRDVQPAGCADERHGRLRSRAG